MRPRPPFGPRPVVPFPLPPIVMPGGGPSLPFPGRVDLGQFCIDPRWLEALLPKPRNQIRVPISPTGQVDETTLLEDPADPAKKMNLPRFELLEQVIDSQRRLRVLMEQVGENWVLSVHFVSTPRTAGVATVESNLSALLRFVPPSINSVTKEVFFTVQKVDPATWTATYMITTLNERDQIFHALTQAEYHTQFVVRCTAAIAVPVPKSVPDSEQLYKEQKLSIDVRLNRDPFLFDPREHAAVFRGIANVSDKSFGLVLRQEEYEGRIHHYYQDEASPWVFYYLPDSFKVTRRASPLNPQILVPSMMVKFSSLDGSLEKMRASLEYVAAPVIDSRRLMLAREAMKRHLPSPLPSTVHQAVFQPLGVASLNQLTLNVAMPRSGSGSDNPGRAGVVVNLTDSFSDKMDDIPLPDFQNVFDALFGKSAVIFGGHVQVHGGTQHSDDVIPFIARLQDLYGKVLEESELLGPNGAIQVTLRNCVESPLLLSSIPVSILAGDQLVAAHIENPTKDGSVAQFPLRLTPNEKLSLHVVPDQPLPAGATVDAIFGIDNITVEPDTDAVWAAILDASVPLYARTVKVMSFEDWFAPTTDVTAIAIDFENGDAVVLPRDHREAEAKVQVPLADIILRKVQEPEYRYTMVVIRGTKQTRVQKSDKLDILLPDIST